MCPTPETNITEPDIDLGTYSGLYKAEAEHAQAELLERVHDVNSYGSEDKYKHGFWAAEPDGIYASDTESTPSVPAQNPVTPAASEPKSGRA